MKFLCVVEINFSMYMKIHPLETEYPAKITLYKLAFSFNDMVTTPPGFYNQFDFSLKLFKKIILLEDILISTTL